MRNHDLVQSLPSRFLEEIPVGLFDEDDPNRVVSKEEGNTQFEALMERLKKNKK